MTGKWHGCHFKNVLLTNPKHPNQASNWMFYTFLVTFDYWSSKKSGCWTLPVIGPSFIVLDLDLKINLFLNQQHTWYLLREEIK